MFDSPGGGADGGAAVEGEGGLGVGGEACRRVVFGGSAGGYSGVVVVFYFLVVVLGDLAGLAYRVAVEILRLDLHEVGAAEVGEGELAEDVVDDRGGHLDVVVALGRAVGLEAGEDEGFRELFEGDAVLEAEGDRDGEAVHQRPEGGAFAVHVDEDLTERAVLELTRSEVDLVAADASLLGVAFSSSGKGSPS